MNYYNKSGSKSFLNDQVFFQGSKISPEQHKYLLLNKPKGYITVTKDELRKINSYEFN